MGSIEDQAETANTVPLLSVYNIKFDYLFTKEIAMVVWLPWKDMRIKNRSCCCGGSMEYTRLMTIPGPLLKCCIYNTNKSFRTCAKVMYSTCGPEPRLTSKHVYYTKLH